MEKKRKSEIRSTNIYIGGSIWVIEDETVSKLKIVRRVEEFDFVVVVEYAGKGRDVGRIWMVYKREAV